MRPKVHTYPMTRRTLRLPEALAVALDYYAAKHGMSANAAAIDLLTAALSGTPELVK